MRRESIVILGLFAAIVGLVALLTVMVGHWTGQQVYPI